MLRRWSIPLATVVIAVGSLLGLAAGNASAAPVHHPSTTSIRPGGAAAHGFKPGGVMLKASGSARTSGHTGRYQAESTNWSGYAVTGGTGAYKSVSASWTQPTATCSGRGDEVRRILGRPRRLQQQLGRADGLGFRLQRQHP